MKLDHLVIAVSNSDQSLNFYSAVFGSLGFQTKDNKVWDSPQGISIEIRNALTDHSYDRYGAGLNHFGFAAETKKEFEGIQAKLTEHGIILPPVQDISGSLCLFLPDPDGLRVEISWEYI